MGTTILHDQNLVYPWKNGKIKYQFTVNELDSTNVIIYRKLR